MIAIIDYGLGNLGSIRNMLKKIGSESIVTSAVSDIEKADRLILPGVGAFDTGMQNIRQMNLKNVLNNEVLVKKKPILGICLGMQLMTLKSEEGVEPGLGWMDAETIKFKFEETGRNFSVPNMGWNLVERRNGSRLFGNMQGDPRFYFVHSYYVKCKNEGDVAGVTNYNLPYHSAFEKENIFGVQFHPEKSHKYGMQLLQNFINR